MSLRDLVGRRLAPLRAYAPKPAPRIKLDANESPWPLPEDARRALAEKLAALPLNRYPDPRATRLRELLVDRVGGAPDDLVVGAGSDEVICILMNALGQPRESRREAVTLSVEPSFVMYRHNAVVCGHRYVGVPLRSDFTLDVEPVCETLAAEQPNLVFLATPNNPTGNAFADDAIAAVVEHAPSSLVVIDEAYGAFAGRSLRHLCDEHGNVALMGTLSKVGLAAARVGYCRLPASIAADVDKVRQPFNLSSLALAAAELALTDLSPILDAQVSKIVSERERLAAALAARDELEPLPSQANFILVRVRGDAVALAERLREREIAVRVFANAPALAGCVRITIGTPEENDALLAAL
jgi:histidinol-phosphate aminotransferase